MKHLCSPSLWDYKLLEELAPFNQSEEARLCCRNKQPSMLSCIRERSLFLIHALSPLWVSAHHSQPAPSRGSQGWQESHHFEWDQREESLGGSCANHFFFLEVTPTTIGSNDHRLTHPQSLSVQSYHIYEAAGRKSQVHPWKLYSIIELYQHPISSCISGT